MNTDQYQTETGSTETGEADATIDISIADLNDAFRQDFTEGMVVITIGVQALPDQRRGRLIEAVHTFNSFTPDNDPDGEHDFGSIELDGLNCFWKIDDYDRDLQYASLNPTDPAITTRVLTIMLAEEY